MKEPHTALFVAPTGVGKTHLALSSIGVGGTSTLYYMMTPLTLFDEAP